MESKYNKKQIELASDIPQFKLGELVKTPDGEGIIVSLAMPYNGLYLSPKQSVAIVWYSADEAANGWVNKEYELNKLQRITT
jgi:hypothetical protein